MRPHISLVTLAVEDLERSVAFFALEGGLTLALWPRRSLAADTDLPPGPS